MESRTKHDSLRKRLTVPGIAMACACVLLGCCTLQSLRELQWIAAGIASVPAVGLRALQYTALFALAVLITGATRAAVLIRRELQARLMQAGEGVPQDETACSSARTEAQLLRSIADALPMRVAYLDQEHRFGFVNRRGCERHGLTHAELLGRPAAEFVTFLRTAKGSEMLQAAYAGEAQKFEHDDEIDGRRLRLATHLEPDFDSSGRVRGLFVTGVDITAEASSRRTLSRQTATLNAIIESMPAMVAVVDPQLRYRLVNNAYERWCVRSRSDLVGHDIEHSMNSAAFEYSLPFVQRALAGETVAYELHNPAAARVRHVGVTFVPFRLEDGSSGGFVSVSQDITVQQEEKDRLLLLSERDPLTGLLNRAGFQNYLSQKVQQGEGGCCGLLYIDLDRFKPINDTYGHAIGDEVLREFAVRLREAVRPSDAVARLGGDEFAVVMPGLREAKHAAATAQKIVELANLPFTVGQQQLRLSASVGVALNAAAAGGWQGLVQRADALLYQSKAAGRARFMLEPQSYADYDRKAG